MLLISYRGIYDGNNFENANTPPQIGKAFNNGFSCMVDAWRENDKIYLGNDQPITEVSANYLKGNRFWINARNTNMQNWLLTQSTNDYPNYFWFPSMPPPTYVVASNGKLVTPGTVPVTNGSVLFLPEINDNSLISMAKVQTFAICSNYLYLIRRMRNEGIWY